MSAHRCFQRIRLWWVERVIDAPFSADASHRLDVALVAWESAR
jgi:hypothetical protein